MAITRTAITDDDGTGTSGTGLDNAWKTQLYDQIDAADTAAIAAAATAAAALYPALPGSTAPTTTGNITAEPIPTGTGVLSTFHNNATLKTIQGMVAGTHGQLWFHYSKGAGQVDFAHLHASGTALGKCRNFATSAPTSMAAGVGVTLYQYDDGVLSGVTAHWRLVSHEQGAWITPTFAAGDYTAATGTWTVGAGDVSTDRYWLRGRTVTHNLRVLTTDVSATPATLIRAIPGGFTALGTSTQLARVSNAGAAIAVGLVVPTGATLTYYATVGAGAWAIATANTQIEYLATIEVT